MPDNDNSVNYEESLCIERPFNWVALRGFLAARAIANVEFVDDWYERTFITNGVHGHLAAQLTDDESLKIDLILNKPTDLLPSVAKFRHMFDLDADIATIEPHLSLDKRLQKTVIRNSGLRVPGAWDGFELAIRAIIGQQITVAGARTILGRLCEKFGSELCVEHDLRGERCNRLFPTPGQIVEADLSTIGLTKTRVKTLQEFARVIATRELILEPTGDPERAIENMMKVKGIGPWTANYISMRAMKYADAFPSGDVALLSAARNLGIACDHKSLEKASKNWRPWRAYAAMHLWQSLMPQGKSALTGLFIGAIK